MPEYLPTVLIIIVIVAICVFAVVIYIKRLNKGCCGAGGGDIEEKIEKSTEGFVHEYHVKIGGMHCDKCAARIAGAFNRQDGVFAEVSYRDGSADIKSREPLPELMIRTTVIGLDYTVDEITTVK